MRNGSRAVLWCCRRECRFPSPCSEVCVLDDGFWFDDDVEGAVKEGEVLLERVGKFWLAMYKVI